MTWESIIGGALTGFSNFVYQFCDIVGGSLNPTVIEGVLALGAIGIVIQILEGKIKISAPKLPKPKRRDEDDEDEYEYIRVRRR